MNNPTAPDLLTKPFQVIAIHLPEDVDLGVYHLLDARDSFLGTHAHLLASEKLLGINLWSAGAIGSSGCLYQWGRPVDLSENKRRIKLIEKDRFSYGNLGIGSICQGRELDGSYIGGGEGFVINGEAYRVTRSGDVYSVLPSEGYWFAQLIDFSNVIRLHAKGIWGGMHSLIDYVHAKLNLGKVPFVITFGCCFGADGFCARSRGIFNHDNQPEGEASGIFTNCSATDGGHLLSLSSNMIISDDIFVKPIDEIKIIEH